MKSRIETWSQAVLTLTSVAALLQAALKRDTQLLVLSLGLAALAVAWRLLGMWWQRPARWRWRLQARYSQPTTSVQRVAQSLLRRVMVDSPELRAAYASSLDRWNSEHRGVPLLAPIGLVDRSEEWPEWAFSTALILGGVRIETAVRPAGELRQSLAIDIGGDTFGIFNNRGKRFVARFWRDVIAENSPRISEVAQRELSRSTTERAISIGEGFPLRWASAGVIPVARWRGKDWVVVFFRDIHPIGWNIANGASDNHVERVNAAALAEREFSEELLVLDHDPGRSRAPMQRRFAFRSPGGKAPRVIGEHFSLARHRRVRLAVDGIDVRLGESEVDHVLVDVVRTPWTVLLTEAGKTYECADVVPSINPEEMGIEVLRIFRFDLRDGDYLLDGELLERDGLLARRPVGLLCLSFLREQFEAGTLSATSRDRRILPQVPDGSFHLFDADVYLRRNRLNAGSPATGEREYLEHWMSSYASCFRETPLSTPIIRTLCPATWKSLDAAFARGVL